MTEFHPIPNDPRFKDRTGLRYGRLTVLGYIGNHRWLCRCDCGGEAKAVGGNLSNGNTRSCGCLQAEITTERNLTHGMTNSSEYRSWLCMLGRCHSPKHIEYPRYGERGIFVCQRWRDSFTAFLEDMGRKPGPEYSIERKDNDGNYEPGNCRWADDFEQQRNKRNNHRITYQDQTLCVVEWAEQLGIPASTILRRLRLGWSEEKALSTPVLKTWSRHRKRQS